MAQSFTATETGALAKTVEGTKRHVLVTGAAGRIGSYFAEHSRDRYQLRLMVREDDEGIDRVRPFGEVVYADLGDLDRLKEICDGIDTVVHMAGDPNPHATWRELREANIDGVYNIFVAAKSAECRRVIHASSIHAVSGYPADVQVKTNEPVNPGDLYGVSKCFGEALARYMAEQEGLSAITLRIGAFQPLESARSEQGLQMLDAFVSQRDLTQLIQRCVDVENVRFAILHGLSDNRFKRLDISDARELVGYDPQDDATEELPQLRDLHLRDAVSSNAAGGGEGSGIREEV
ncbi:MAG: NAD(P)-dependent oxidoreductase [Armatimonadetes bacterium]|nr:NAD(P)-dependent oxidoreductase [Armatimonadota bacterium]